MEREGQIIQSFQCRLQIVTYICIRGENQTIILVGDLRDKLLQHLQNKFTNDNLL